ncbi:MULTISPECIES: hypothetical protein [unclassified Variovorax]|uniref:hypothetical protein n=1 Tax=unclassified Variovorax TaxID=663243 RepID=UPI00076C9837|nr:MULTISPECIES: hypothetical protein [unclassified Variovorax]KWT98369.1 hypothetical protein APY03_0504 [Variovorax sp. WDL1]PNG49972.1 hypothetical protein CHC06_05553 [Variovorax sp. B2]PNG50844.1 hypothetical protein CHC07_05458 [Variovorax sp. B4]VTU41742.1 hypothetical protein H6P1_00037 [Variovorax sp. PBL-H6]VTU44568.1 hypothetical protein SRS16P1_00865 [Variovorax sp. SRS16]
MTSFLVKNGKGGYVEALEAMRLGYDYDGYSLYHGGLRFTPFEVETVEPHLDAHQSCATVSELEESGLLRTETGRLYRRLPSS